MDSQLPSKTSTQDTPPPTAADCSPIPNEGREEEQQYDAERPPPYVPKAPNPNFLRALNALIALEDIEHEEVVQLSHIARNELYPSLRILFQVLEAAAVAEARNIRGQRGIGAVQEDSQDSTSVEQVVKEEREKNNILTETVKEEKQRSWALDRKVSALEKKLENLQVSTSQLEKFAWV